MLAASFYDQVLRELIVAIGAALLVGNLLAILRRRRDAAERGGPTGSRSAVAKGSSRVRATGRTAHGELVQAPVARSLTFAALGLIMVIAGVAAIVAS